ncbi:FAD-dependent oxidoreductase [Rhodococcus koreensis]|uniref:oxidoreductase n=1 Tax=Rhodococcus koreensis TaxID=99653 RepID=UPI003672EA32
MDLVRQPIDLGAIRVKNRIVLTPHVSFLAENHLPSQRLVDYLEERAKGGVGLITVEASSVHPSNVPYEGVLFAFDPKSVDGYSRIVEAVTAHGARCVLELSHKGAAAKSGILSGRPLLGPSGIPEASSLEVPRAMSLQDIADVRAGFALAAKHAVMAGFDGVEVHSTHGYLPQQFLSPLFNRRTDQYGGSLVNRMRFLTEVLDAVRSELGSEKALGVRLAGHELTPGGLETQDFAEIAVRLVDAGLVDYISVTASTHFSYNKIIPTVHAPAGTFVAYAHAIRSAIQERVPVIVAGKITTLAEAEAVISSGKADLVGMTRANIADPHLVRKTLSGEVDDVRPCVGANICISHSVDRRPLSCGHNPTVSRERESKKREGDIRVALEKTAVTPRIGVIGGGISGLKAAETAARMGAQVTLFERERELGGALRYITVGSVERAPLLGIAQWLADRVTKLGVTLRLGESAPGGQSAEFDAWIVATGSTADRTGFSALMPDEPVLPGIDGKNVVFPDEVLRSGYERDSQITPLSLSDGRSREVLVIDDDSGWIGYSVASYFAEGRHPTTLVTAQPKFGHRILGTQEVPDLHEQLRRRGVKIVSHHLVGRIDDLEATAIDLDNGEAVSLGEFGVVCVSRSRKAHVPTENRDVLDDPRTLVIGDAAAPRGIFEAVNEGYWSTLGLFETVLDIRPDSSSREANLVGQA